MKTRFFYNETDDAAKDACKKIADSLNDGSPGKAVSLTIEEFKAFLDNKRVIKLETE